LVRDDEKRTERGTLPIYRGLVGDQEELVNKTSHMLPSRAASSSIELQHGNNRPAAWYKRAPTWCNRRAATTLFGLLKVLHNVRIS